MSDDKNYDENTENQNIYEANDNEDLVLVEINEIENNSPIDIVEFSLKDAWNTLGEIIGETYTEELLDELFSRFCLGK